MDDIEALRLALAQIVEGYQVAYNQLLRDYGSGMPLRIQDTSGRYILLDALTAIVNARTALVNAER